MTTAVYFDLDGTVVSYDRSFDDLFASALERFDEPFSRTAYEAYTDRLFAALEACESEPYRRGFEAARGTGDLTTPAADVADAYRTVELEATVVSEDAKAVIERLASDHSIGFLTNGDGRQQRAKLRRHGLNDVAEAVVVSNDAGVCKPDERIFELARERLPADDYVFVGDSYEDDIVPAAALGFRTIHVSEDPDGTGAADAVVSCVGELDDSPLAILE